MDARRAVEIAYEARGGLPRLIITPVPLHVLHQAAQCITLRADTLVACLEHRHRPRKVGRFFFGISGHPGRAGRLSRTLHGGYCVNPIGNASVAGSLERLQRESVTRGLYSVARAEDVPPPCGLL